jgi:exopolysaccharide production protein ExoQ
MVPPDALTLPADQAVEFYPAMPTVHEAPRRRRWWQSHGFHSLLFFALFYVLAPYDIMKSAHISAGTSRADINDAVDKFGGGNPVRNAVIFALGSFAIVSLLQRSDNRVRTRGALGGAIVLFLAWAALSPLWGDDPLTTGKKVVGMIFLALAALAMARQSDGPGLIQFAIFSLGSFVATSILAELIVGSFHPLEAGYRFAGLVHPNAMGSDCAILAIASFAYARHRTRWSWLYYALAFAALVLLVFTRSRTALLAGMAGFAVCAALLAGPRAKLLVGLGVAALGTIAVAAGNELQALVAESVAMGRTDAGASDVGSFTGRSEIWAQLWEYVRQRPVVGYGYNSFWSPERLLEVALRQGFASPSAHSGLLEVTLSLGVVGGVLLLVVLMLAVIRAVRAWQHHRQIEYAFMAAALVALCVNITTESIILHATIGSFVWMIMLARLGHVEPSPAAIHAPPAAIEGWEVA